MMIDPTKCSEYIGKLWVNTSVNTKNFVTTNREEGLYGATSNLIFDVTGDFIGDITSHATGVNSLGYGASGIWAAGVEYFDPKNADLSTPEKITKAVEAGVNNVVVDIVKDAVAKTVGNAFGNFMTKKHFEKDYDDIIKNYSYNVHYDEGVSASDNYLTNKENIDNSFMYTDSEIDKRWAETDKKIQDSCKEELQQNEKIHEYERDKIIQDDIKESKKIEKKYDGLKKDLMNDTQEKLNEELQSPENQEKFAQNKAEHENNLEYIKEQHSGNEEELNKAIDKENADYLAKDKEIIDNTESVKEYNKKYAKLEEAEKAEQTKNRENTQKKLEDNDKKLEEKNTATNEKASKLQTENNNARDAAKDKNKENYNNNIKENDNNYSQQNQSQNEKDFKQANSDDNAINNNKYNGYNR